jgi:hypothetical protein
MAVKTKTRNQTVAAGTYGVCDNWSYLPAPGVWQERSPVLTGAFIDPIESSSIDTYTGQGFHPCTHLQTFYSRFGKDTVVFAPPGYVGKIRMNPKHLSRISFPSGIAAPVYTDVNWYAQDQRAIGSMIPSAGSGLSLINFLIELKDFRKLVQAFWNRKGVVQALIFGEAADWSELGTHPLKSLSHAYLNYSFNWRPFVSDLQKIYAKLVTTNRRLDELWARQNRPQTRHYDAPLNYGTYNTDWVTGSEVVSLRYTSEPDGGKTAVSQTVNSRWVQTPIYRATMRYSYRVPGAKDLQYKIKGWLDAFGVKLDASIIWNAIPFSFIIDWIVDVGGFLRSFSKDNLGLQVIIEDFCSSVSHSSLVQKRFRALGTDHPVGNITYSPDSVIVAETFTRTYYRRTGIPNIRGALLASGLDPSEASLGTALILSRGKRK